MCDKDIGGYSTASFDWVPASSNEPAHVRFHGNISNKLPADKPDVHRSGFAGWRTWDRPPTLFGRSLWNVEPYKYLALRVKSDGRNYYVNLQTESIVPTDIHQHRLYTKSPGKWETVFINWDDFVRTNHGFVVEPQKEMLKQKVRTVGMSLTDSIPGPFDICIGRIWGTNERESQEEPSISSSMEKGMKKLSSESK
jgi:NADH dehydrogenase [ubiquinone] 1 alpha subcomplex assembly factor 1